MQIDLTNVDRAVALGKITPLEAAALAFEALGMTNCRKVLGRVDITYYGRPPKPDECPDTPGDSAAQVNIDTLRLLGLDLTGKRRRAVWKAIDAPAKAARTPSDDAITTAVEAAYRAGHKLLAADHGYGAFVEAAEVLGMHAVDVQMSFYRIRKIERTKNERPDK